MKRSVSLPSGAKPAFEGHDHDYNTHLQASLLELAYDAIIVRDPQSRVVSWNRGAEQLYGWSAQEAIGRVSHELLQTRFPETREALERFLATGELWQGELLHTRKDGTQVLVESRQTLRRSAQGELLAILEINRDITERKQREQEQLERYYTIVRTAYEGIWLIDTEARTLFVNERMAEMLGYAVEELVGRRVPEFVFPEDLAGASERIGSNLQGHFEQFDFRFRRKDGTALAVLACTSPMRDAHGEITGALGMFSDVSERQQIEYGRRQLAALVESAAIPIIGKTREGIITSWNSAAEQMYGYSAQEAVGQSITLIFPPDRQDEFTMIMERIRQGERVDLYETVRRRKDGTLLPVSITVSPIYESDGQISGASDIAHDITERLLVERRKDEFISMASHELKTPVTSLKGFTNILQRRLTREGDAQGLHQLARMDAQLDRLTALISELLDISRMQSGKLALREEPVALDTLIEEIVEEMQAATVTHALLIEGRTGAQVMGDQERLRQVFVNLLTNAIKYSPRAEKVIVRLSRDDEGGQAIVSVQDFGIGIDKKHHEHVFERFYQVTDPDGTTYPGLGIGLYISREIVERHQGRLWVESSKGNGATFFVTLPFISKGV